MYKLYIFAWELNFASENLSQDCLFYIFIFMGVCIFLYVVESEPLTYKHRFFKYIIICHCNKIQIISQIKQGSEILRS